jgi:RHS repeat-associated protein
MGTVHAVADSTGTNIVEQYRFDAWGRVLGVYDGSGNPLSQSAIGTRFLWQGREYGWATGLYYFRARWYDPVVGRWLSNDPIGISGGLNQYTFCFNNPVNYVDPFGDEPYTKKELEDALKVAQSGLELREKQEQALKANDLKEWQRLQDQRDIVGLSGRTIGKYPVIDAWENCPKAKEHAASLKKAVMGNLFASDAVKKGITTKFEKERQQMAIEYIKKQMELLPKDPAESLKK